MLPVIRIICRPGEQIQMEFHRTRTQFIVSIVDLYSFESQK